MPVRRNAPGGELEQAVLVAVWELETASIREIYERVGSPQGLVYTTIAKVVDRLVSKRLLLRTGSSRAFRYQACVSRRAVERAQIRETLNRLLGGDAAPAMATLVEAVEELDPELLDDLARAVSARRKRRR
ncbi:MAG: BlaI/MecI/CopY family transcriptional regulator [Thermoanaerobaculia bacterium]